MRIHQRYLVIYKRGKPFKWAQIETKNYSMLRLIEGSRVIYEADCCFLFLPYKLHLKIENFLDRISMREYNSLEAKMHDLLYGILSGFPPCCIFQFLRRGPRLYARHPLDPDDFVRCGYHRRKSWKKYEQKIASSS
jgi:hypothetical protein